MLKRMLPIAAVIIAAVIGLDSAPGTSSSSSQPSLRLAQLQIPAAIQREPSNFRVVQLPTLGGVQAFANFINDKGWASGSADLTGDRKEHATLWRAGQVVDLGTLGGPNSLAWHVSDGGQVVIESDTSVVDPFRENACQFVINGVPEFSDRTCRGAVLVKDVMEMLPTLGGNNDTIFGTNNRGQFVGTAEDRTKDPSCIAPQVLDSPPVIWGPNGEIRALPVYPGDSTGAAVAINDEGQSVGASGPCEPISFATGAHALLWQDGSATYLGGFGGKMFNIAFGINNRGQVVGFSDLTGDTTSHAFLWQSGVMTDLGTLPGDFSSFAFGINDRGQVVGQSCDVNFNCRAFIWQNGVMTDLNALVAPGSALYLVDGFGINAGGEIAGLAFDQSTGGGPAFVAIPTRGRGAHPASRVTLSASVRTRVRQLLGFRD